MRYLILAGFVLAGACVAVPLLYVLELEPSRRAKLRMTDIEKTWSFVWGLLAAAWVVVGLSNSGPFLLDTWSYWMGADTAPVSRGLPRSPWLFVFASLVVLWALFGVAALRIRYPITSLGWALACGAATLGESLLVDKGLYRLVLYSCFMVLPFVHSWEQRRALRAVEQHAARDDARPDGGP
jgi:hypothetical protein